MNPACSTELSHPFKVSPLSPVNHQSASSCWLGLFDNRDGNKLMQGNNVHPSICDEDIAVSNVSTFCSLFFLILFRVVLFSFYTAIYVYLSKKKEVILLLSETVVFDVQKQFKWKAGSVAIL